MCEREFEQQMRKANTTKCLFRLRSYCVVLSDLGTTKYEFGSTEFIQLYCSMCVKTVYAKAKNRRLNKYSVVNTL